MPTHDIDRIRATHDAIKEKTPELIVNLSSAVGMNVTAEQRIAQITAVKPAMASTQHQHHEFRYRGQEIGAGFN